MQILFTGGSSFSGYWFVRALAEAGHQVTAPLLRARGSYRDGPRAERVKELANYAELVEECPFGSPRFLELCASKPFDLLCHHASRLVDYKSPDFDIPLAVAENTANIQQVLRALPAVRAVLYSGSVFEAGEAAGSPPLAAFSPYGVSKGLSAEIIAYYCGLQRLGFGKFVIPNPFGPYEEEARFCRSLIERWKRGEVASVQTPHYLRDNIHIDLLAGAYLAYAEALGTGQAPTRLYPSGYVEEQGAFAERLARELRARSALTCELVLADSHPFKEPQARFNTTPATHYAPRWNESAAWDGLARYYAL